MIAPFYGSSPSWMVVLVIELNLKKKNINKRYSPEKKAFPLRG